MTDQDDRNSNQGFASMDKETRERIARKGGEESHKNDPGRSGSSRGSSSGREGRSSSNGRREGGGQGIWYDEDAGQCRDDSGQFVECPDEIRGSRQDPNKERVASRGGEHSHGGHGREPGSASSSSRSGRD
jgi:hypothetical protein